MVNVVELAESVVRLTVRLGATDCDVMVSDSRFTSAEIEKGSMKQSNQMRDPGVGIRAYKNGCAGFSFCTGFDKRTIRRAAALAVAYAGAGTPDPDFKSLPPRQQPTKVAGLFERKTAELEPEDIVEMAISLSDHASDDKKITSVNAGVTAGSGTLALANSNGFSASQKMSAFEASAEAVAREGSEMSSGVDSGWSRRLSAEMVSAVGDSAREHAIKGLTHTRIATGSYPVVMDPLAAGFVLGMAIGGGVNAESVQRKRSYLTGKLGDIIGSEHLTIVDDPTLEWMVGSYSFDGEGTKGRRKTVVDKGKLSMYLYDSYTAGKEDRKSTGNASRGGSVWDFRKTPTIAPSNLVIQRGDYGAEEMISETRSGVYLRLTYDYPNLATGEFSGLMMESYEIAGGEIGRSIRQATIGVRLLDMFARIDMVGKKPRDVFGVRTPPLRISEARIGGSN